MANPVVKSFTETGSSEALGLASGHLQVSGTFVATLVIETSVDGLTWVAGADVSTPDLYRVDPGVVVSVRVTCTSHTSGTAVCSLKA